MKQKFNIHKQLFLSTVLYFAFMSAIAQTHPIKNAFATVSESNGQSTATFTVMVEDTTAVNQIKTMLGSQRDSIGNLVNELFDFDVTTGLPSGVSYQRSGNKLTLMVNGITSASTYFGKVSVKNNSNIWKHYKFITN